MANSSSRIILVHDNEEVGSMVESLLKQTTALKCTVTSCREAKDAARSILSGMYDLALIDAAFRSGDGHCLALELSGQDCQIPVILLTEAALSRADIEALRHGVSDCLVRNRLSAQDLERAFVNALARKRNEIRMQQRLRLDRIIAEASMRFINIRPRQIDLQIARSLQSLGEATGANQCIVCHFTHNQASLKLIAHWVQAVSNVPTKTGQVLMHPSITKLREKLVSSGNLSVINPAQEHEILRTILGDTLNSIRLVPMLGHSKVLGFIGIAENGMAAEYSPEVASLVASMAEIFAGALQQQEIEEALEESENRYRNLVESLGEGILYCDVEDNILQVNSRTCEITGYSPSEMLGRKAYELIVPEGQGHLLRERTLRRLRGISERYEISLMRKDKTCFWAEISAVPIRDMHGKIIGTLGAVTDISQRRSAEAEALRLQRQLLHSQKMDAIGQLAAGIAHDLNNALGAVVGHLQLLKIGSSLSPDDRKSVDIALMGCERALGQIEHLLGFARHHTSNARVTALQSIVDETLNFLGRVIGQEYTLTTQGSAEGLAVRVDQGQFQQAITNLVINAKQAMPQGGAITFEFGVAKFEQPQRFNAAAKPGEYVVVRVSDTGPGIPPENIDKIFEPFFTTRAGQGGNGLGLSMVYAIMQSHGGWIEVQSEPGHGAAFSLVLPRVEMTHEDQPRTNLKMQPGRQRCILVIDDEPILVDLMQKFLDMAGFTSHGYTSAEEAVEWYREHYRKVDLIVLDMKMAKMDGTACFEALRSINPHAQVAILSGYFQDSAVQDLLVRGALRFFQKPLKYPEIINWLSTQLSSDEIA